MITKDWLQAQLLAYSLQQTNTREDLSGRFADVIMAEIRASENESVIDKQAQMVLNRRINN